MVSVNIKSTDGAKAKEFRRKTKTASVARARQTMYAARRAPQAGVRGERKFFNTIDGSTTIAITGTITNASLNLIPQGVTESTRVGRKCVIKQISGHGTMTLPPTAVVTETSDQLRIIVYLDKQANGAAATPALIMDDNAGTGVSIQGFRNLEESLRFQVLSDKRYAFSCGAGSGRGTTDTLSYAEVVNDWNFNKYCDIPIEFSGTSGAITTVRSNNIGVLMISASGFMSFNGEYRVRFSDQ